MSFEKGYKNESEDSDSEHLSGGPANDFEKIFQSLMRTDALKECPKARDLVDQAFEVIDTSKFPQESGNIVTVIEHIRLVAKENKWSDYDSVQFEKIRKELESAGIPLQPRKTREDLW